MFNMNFSFSNGHLWFILAIQLFSSCSHKYDSNILDLAFYQWNQWPDEAADWSREPLENPTEDLSQIAQNPPSCGWEELHRGNGRLLRIPAALPGYKGVSWYHCRFTLPELWNEQQIVFMFDSTGPQVEVYLNEALVGYQMGQNSTFHVDVTNVIYYTRDNHLAIRITDPDGTGGLGGLIVKSAPKPL